MGGVLTVLNPCSLGRIPFGCRTAAACPGSFATPTWCCRTDPPGWQGFAKGSRGCKQLCRHCPVVRVYQGTFRIVPADVVMAGIRQQVREGATHISFGDPDLSITMWALSRATSLLLLPEVT